MNQRQGTQSTLTRSEVSGGGKKPWRQKGTGRARQGSTRSPQWTHGGIALGPKPRSYRIDLNKKTKRVAMLSALSSKVAEKAMVVIDEITMNEYKTKTMQAMLTAVKAQKKVLVVMADANPFVIKSLANLEGVKSVPATSLNVYDILNCDTLIMAKAAAKKVEEVYSK
jgi:large subunit ribosomal protein L4